MHPVALAGSPLMHPVALAGSPLMGIPTALVRLVTSAASSSRDT
jgi:hypothetical protein